MLDNHTINHFIKYEITTLKRNRGLKCILYICTTLVCSLHIITQSNLFSPEWIAIALPSSIPFANAYLINYLQVFIIIIWANLPIEKHQTKELPDSIQIRPFKNIELLSGKILGFIYMILVFTLSLNLIAIAIHLFISNSPFSLYPYLFYHFTLTLPTLIFTTGITLFMKGIIKNKAISSIILLAFLYIEIAYGKNILHGSIDLFASSLPNTFSDITGFSGLNLYLLQRLSFFLWGFGFILFGIFFLNRLPNSKRQQSSVSKCGLCIILLGFIPTWTFISTFTQQKKERDQMRHVFAQYENTPKISIGKHEIQFEQKDKKYFATSKITILNSLEQPLDSVILYLNPGLNVTRLSENNIPLNFHRKQQVITIRQILQPHEIRTFEIQYEGTINPAICYAEITNLDSLAISRNYGIFNLGKDFYYLQTNFTLLTPECLWYPNALPPVNLLSPYIVSQNYTNFQLTVIGEKERTPISQGKRITQGDTTRFINTNKQTGLSLCIGKYNTNSVSANNISFELYRFKKHIYLTGKIKDPSILIKTWLGGLEYNNQKYLFSKLALIEIPINFCAFSRNGKNGSEYIQPEIIFRPEREASISTTLQIPTEALNPGIPPEIEWFSGYMNNYSAYRSLKTGNQFSNLLCKSIKKRAIKNEYNISTLLQRHHLYLTSPEFPGIHLIFQKIQEQLATSHQNYNNNPCYTYASKYFKEHNLQAIFQDKIDILQFEELLYTKSLMLLLNTLQTIPKQELYHFIEKFCLRHVFSEINYEQFCNEIEYKYHIDLKKLTRQLYHTKGLPNFVIKDARLQEIPDRNGITGYQYSVKVWNKGNIDGIITINDSHTNQHTHYLIPAGKSKEIYSYIEDLDNEFEIRVYTNLSQNIPAFYTFNNIQPTPFHGKPRTGIFDIDTTSFLPPKNEYIVDNEDATFKIIDPGEKLTRFMKQQNKHDTNNPNHKQWTYSYYNRGGYGEPVKSYYKKLAGNGNSKVEWETTLPVAGEYELFVYHDEMTFKNNGYVKKYVNYKEITINNPTQTYLFTHQNGQERIVLDTRQAGYGWISLGIFPFPQGKTQITLLDLGSSPFQIIIADAVKWVKIK